MKADTGFVFDVDDTLYDRAEPFGRALEELLGKKVWNNVRKWYLIYSRCSQEMFELHEAGKISLEESRILRIQKAMELCGEPFDPEQARRFQENYLKFQGRLTLSCEMAAMLEECRDRGITLGLMTNGPFDHQMRKIESLGLLKWVRPEHIWISGKIGSAKPDQKIFKLAQEQLGLSGECIWMIGDSYDSDIAGAMEAGWHTIWLNKDQKNVPAGKKAPDRTVSDGKGLKESVGILAKQFERERMAAAK